MQKAALIIGVLGGIFGIIAAIFALFFGGLIGISVAEEGSLVTGLGIGALVSSIVGIVGAVLTNISSRWAGSLMLIAGIGGFISISTFYVIAGPLLIIGGILTLVSNKIGTKQIP